ncbi:MAG: hypothetical protein GY810_28760 [Aureispira sp.]|nr:hypothetical protein [Aureispira sp.]
MQATSQKPTQLLLFVIALGIWGLFLQNLGVIPVLQTVNVSHITSGQVGVYGTVTVENEVGVDIKKINGWNAANYNEYSLEGYEFHSLGIHNNIED